MSYYTGHGVTVHHADSLDLLPTLDDNTVDAVVTDPPYGLEFMGKDWDKFKGANDWGRAGETSEWTERPNGGWDPFSKRDTPRYTAGQPFQAWCQRWAAECLRVLKPGGHLLAFGGTRTHHRLTSGIEDAGFEIRDSIPWLYGSGFPKSLDVSKAIDKARHAADDVRRATAWIAAHATARQLDEVAGTNGMGGHWTTQGAQAAVPTAEAWACIAGLLPEPPGWLQALIKPARQPGEAWDQRPITQAELRPLVSGEHITFDQRSSKERERRDIPATVEARRWQGWGTALKPGHEPIVVARKPLQGTVAANVLAWGTGGLNIDACRIGDEPLTQHGRGDSENTSMAGRNYAEPAGRSWTGRWPANVVLDEAAATELDQQSGELTSGALRPYTERHNKEADSGGASRFFYTAKAGADERVTLNGVAHPTVKPLDLMRWLVRLVTPPGGLVLDPFAGSGTTAEACILEGFRCIAIEREADYLPMIVQRVNRRRDPVAYAAASGEDGGLFDLLDGDTA